MSELTLCVSATVNDSAAKARSTEDMLSFELKKCQGPRVAISARSVFVPEKPWDVMLNELLDVCWVVGFAVVSACVPPRLGKLYHFQCGLLTFATAELAYASHAFSPPMRSVLTLMHSALTLLLWYAMHGERIIWEWKPRTYARLAGAGVVFVETFLFIFQAQYLAGVGCVFLFFLILEWSKNVKTTTKQPKEAPSLRETSLTFRF
jgi:hypothetical protein